MGGGNIAFSAKRSTHTVPPPHTVDTVKYGWLGPLPLVQKGQPYPHAVDKVGIGSKRSNPCSGCSKYGWWGLLPLVQKGKPYPHAVDTVGVGSKRSNPHSGHSKYGWWGPLPSVQKGQPYPTQWMQKFLVQKGQTHAVDTLNMGGGAFTFSTK